MRSRSGHDGVARSNADSSSRLSTSSQQIATIPIIIAAQVYESDYDLLRKRLIVGVGNYMLRSKYIYIVVLTHESDSEVLLNFA